MGAKQPAHIHAIAEPAEADVALRRKMHFEVCLQLDVTRVDFEPPPLPSVYGGVDTAARALFLPRNSATGVLLPERGS